MTRGAEQIGRNQEKLFEAFGWGELLRYFGSGFVNTDAVFATGDSEVSEVVGGLERLLGCFRTSSPGVSYAFVAAVFF